MALGCHFLKSVKLFTLSGLALPPHVHFGGRNTAKCAICQYLLAPSACHTPADGCLSLLSSFTAEGLSCFQCGFPQFLLVLLLHKPVAVGSHLLCSSASPGGCCGSGSGERELLPISRQSSWGHWALVHIVSPLPREVMRISWQTQGSAYWPSSPRNFACKKSARSATWLDAADTPGLVHMAGGQAGCSWPRAAAWWQPWVRGAGEGHQWVWEGWRSAQSMRMLRELILYSTGGCAWGAVRGLRSCGRKGALPPTTGGHLCGTVIFCIQTVWMNICIFFSFWAIWGTQNKQ